jgi:deoxycytidylate deaminase
MTRCVGECAKRKVRCTIITADGRTFVGENSCLNPQQTCPRRDDEGYEKCATVCQQLGHAEVNALTMLMLAGADGKGGTAFIQGHHRACSPCQEALKASGIDRIFFGERFLRDTDGWQSVVLIGDLKDDGTCPSCQGDYVKCACPGPTDDENFEYRYLENSAGFGMTMMARRR